MRQVRQIHRRLPAGGILVFVTGQREVEHLVRGLRSALAPAAMASAPAAEAPAPPADEVLFQWGSKLRTLSVEAAPGVQPALRIRGGSGNGSNGRRACCHGHSSCCPC